MADYYARQQVSNGLRVDRAATESKLILWPRRWKIAQLLLANPGLRTQLSLSH